MDIEFAESTRTGGRERNEDSHTHVVTDHGTLFLVADGLGAYRGGELASRYFCEAIVKLLPAALPQINTEPEITIQAQIEHAAREMNRSLSSHRLDSTPRTTCVLAWITDAAVIAAHVGDSRLYLLDKQQVLWRSHDHSIAEILVAEGELDEKQVRNHPDQAKLYRSIGGNKPPKPAIKRLDRLQHNQGLLLCSDGFWEYIEPDEMIPLVECDNLNAGLEALTEKAVNRAGPSSDNVTAQFIRLK